jgi:hypothetical protein
VGVALRVDPAEKGAESSVQEEDGVAMLVSREARERGVAGSEAL